MLKFKNGKSVLILGVMLLIANSGCCSFLKEHNFSLSLNTYYVNPVTLYVDNEKVPDMNQWASINLDLTQFTYELLMSMDISDKLNLSTSLNYFPYTQNSMYGTYGSTSFNLNLGYKLTSELNLNLTFYRDYTKSRYYNPHYAPGADQWTTTNEYLNYKNNYEGNTNKIGLGFTWTPKD